MAQRVVIQVVADASQAQGVVDAINKSLGNIGGTAFKAATQNVNQLSDGMLKAVQSTNQLVSAGYRLTLGISAPLIAATTYVVKLGAELESARAAFEVFTGSLVLANRHLEDLKQLALSAPLDFTQILSLSRYLQAAGIEAQRVIPLLKSVGNALIVSGDPSSIERIVQQLVRIQNLGRVTLRELNPLARIGIPVFDELADAIRKPGEEADRTSVRLRNLLKSGNLPGPEFLSYFQAIQKVRFPEGLEKAAATLKGQFQELLNDASIAAGNLGEALAPAALLLVHLFTDVAKVLNSVALTIQQLPVGIRLLIGLFVGLAAIVGPLVLAFGYLSSAIAKGVVLFTELTGALIRNTEATSAVVLASNATAVAKTKEAAATELVVKAVQDETRAKAAFTLSNDSSLAKQLPFIFSDPRRNSRGQFTKGPPALPVTAPKQLGLFDTLNTSESSLIGKGAADDAVAGAAVAATTSRLTTLLGVLGKFAAISAVVILVVDTLYKGFKAFGELAPKLTGMNNELDSIGVSLNKITAIPVGAISAVTEQLDKLATAALGTKEGTLSKGFNTITDAVSLALNPTNLLSAAFKKVGDELERVTKDIEDFKNKHPDFNLTKDVANLGTNRSFITAFPLLGLASAGATRSLADDKAAADAKTTAADKDKLINQQAADAAAEALRQKIKLNEAEEIYAKNLQLTEQGQRQSREFAIVAEGRELGGLQLINKELDKYIDKLTTHIEKIPGTDLTEERVRALSNTEQLNIFRALITDTATEIKKVQKDIAEAAYKSDEESYKLRITALDQYAKDRVSRLQALNIADENSTLEVARRTTEIESAAASQRSALEDSAAIRENQKRKAELDKQQQALNTPDNIRQRALVLTRGNPNVSAAQIIALEQTARQTAQNQINAQRDIADKDLANKLTANKNALNSALYNLDLEYVNKENALFKEANNEHIAATSAAAVQILNFQKQAVEQSKQVQLTALEFQQPVGLQQTLALKTQELAILTDASRKETTISLEESARRNTELRRLEVVSLNNRFEDDENGRQLKAQAISDFDKKAVEEQVEIYSKGYDEIGNIQRQSALQQFQAIRDNALTVFDSIKSASKGLLDELFDKNKTKTFGQIIGDTIKGVLKNAFVDLLSSQISAGYTQLVTGQKVSLQPTKGGGLLSSLFGTKPVVGSNGAPITPGGLTAEQIAVISASVKQSYDQAVATSAIKITPSEVSTNITDENINILKTLSDKYGKEGIVEVKLNNSEPIKVIIAGYEASAKAEQDTLKADIAKGIIPQSEIDRQNPDVQEQLTQANASLLRKRTPQFPVAGNFTLSSAFGLRNNPNEPGTDQYHRGIDIAGVPGTPVIAALSGTVTKVNEDFKTLGNSIRIINEQTGLTTLYAHLINKPDVIVGQTVNQSTPLGGIGATGNATGPNLHFGVYNAAGQPIDPNTVLNQVQPIVNTSAKSIDSTIDYASNYLAAKYKQLTSSPSAYTAITHTPIYYQQKTDSTAGEYHKVGDNIDLYLDNTHRLGDAKTNRTILHEETHAAITGLNVPGASSSDLYDTAQYNAVNKFLPASLKTTAYNALNNTTSGGYANPSDAQREIVPRLVSGEGYSLGLTKAQADEDINKLINGLKLSNDPEFIKLASTLSRVSEASKSNIDTVSFDSPYYINAGQRNYKGAGSSAFDSLISGSKSRDIDSSVLGQQTKANSIPVTLASDQELSKVQQSQQKDVFTQAATEVAQTQAPVQDAIQRQTTDAIKEPLNNISDAITTQAISSPAQSQSVNFPFLSGGIPSTGTGITALPTSPAGLLGGTPSSTVATGGGFNIAALLPGGVAGAAGGIIAGAAVGAAAGTAEHFSKASELQRALESAYKVHVDPKYAQAIYDNVIAPKYGGNIQAGLRDQQVLSMVQSYSASGQGKSGFGTNVKSFFTQGGALGTAAASLPLAGQLGVPGLSGRGTSYVQNANGTITATSGLNVSAIPGLGINPQVSGGLNQIGKIFGGSTSQYNQQQQAYNSQQVSQQGFTKTLTNFLKTGKFLGKAPQQDSSKLPDLSSTQDLSFPYISGGIPTTNLPDIALSGTISPDITGTDLSSLSIGAPAGYGLGDASAGSISNLPTIPSDYSLGSGLASDATGAVSSAATSVGGLTGALGSTNSALSGVLNGPGGQAIAGLSTGLGLGLFSAGLSQKAGTGPGAVALTAGGGAAAGFGLSKQLGLSPLAGIGAGFGAGLFASGVKKGGVIGLGEDIGGGAIAGASIGSQFGIVGAGVGAAVGATVGAVTGLVRLVVKGAAQKVQDDVKTLYNVSISRQYAQSIYDTIIKPQYGGNIEAGIRSKAVLDMLSLYSSSTGQKFGIANEARSLQLIQTGTGLTQAANYQNNQALSFANLGVYGGVSTQTILSPQHLSTGGLAAYQQLPGQGDAAVFNLAPSVSPVAANGTNLPTPNGVSSSNSTSSTTATVPANITVENKLPADQVGNYFDGRTVRTIANNPSTVAGSVNNSYINNVGRNSAATSLVSPNELLT